jgi:hypothetical protein
MIATLRRRHLRMVAGLCMVLPVALAAGHAVRRGPDPIVTLPPALAAVEVPRGARLVWERTDLWADAEHVVRLYAGPDGDQRLLELEVRSRSARPDLLLYWLPAGVGADAEAPGEGSYLLGPVPGPGLHRYRLPAGPALADGRLLLFSLAHGEGMPATSLLPADGEAVR